MARNGLVFFLIRNRENNALRFASGFVELCDYVEAHKDNTFSISQCIARETGDGLEIIKDCDWYGRNGHVLTGNRRVDNEHKDN